MPLTKLTQSVDVVQTLSDRPNALDGLDAAQLKAKFDEAANIIKAYLNNVLIPELEAGNIDIIDNYVTKIELSNNRKLSSLGNFTGSWHGIANPTFADPGIANVVNQHTAQLADFTSISNNFIAHSNAKVTDANGVHGLKIESGTFTPVVKGLTTAGSNTYTTRDGYYYKIGNRVFFEIYINLGTKDVAMAGALSISGLPFASSNSPRRRPSVHVSRFEKLNFGTAKGIAAYVNENSADIIIAKMNDNSVLTTFDASDLGSNLTISLSGDYQV